MWSSARLFVPASAVVLMMACGTVAPSDSAEGSIADLLPETTYEIYHSPDGPVGIIRNGGPEAETKLTTFISGMCGGKYRVEPRIQQCVENCGNAALYAIAYECEES